MVALWTRSPTATTVLGRPDGGGVSLAKTNSDLATDVAASWAASSQIGGTPVR